MKVEAESIRTRGKVDQSLEVGVTNRPHGDWKVVLMMIDGKRPIKRFLGGIRYLAVYEKDFLVDLSRDQLTLSIADWHTAC